VFDVCVFARVASLFFWKKIFKKGSICQYQPKKDKNSMKSILPGVNEERLASFKLQAGVACVVSTTVSTTRGIYTKNGKFLLSLLL